MPTINEIQIILQEKTGKRITYTEIGDIIGTGRSNISLRAKNNSQATDKEMKLLENFYKISLPKDINDCVEVPVRGNLYASLGQGIEIVDENQTGVYSVSRKLMKDVGASPNNTDFIPCEGDSMFPTIEGGALLMVDRSKTEVFDGKIYCVRLNGNLIAKRLQFIPPNSIKVISDNKDKYDPFYVDLSKTLDYDFAIIGQVKWYGTIVR